MSRLTLLLLYQTVLVLCSSSDISDSLYEGASEDSKFNMLDLLMKSSGEKARESKSRETTESSLENWTGRWMPDRAGDPTPPPKIFPIGSSEEAAAIHRQSMGPNKACDDGKTNLTVDWDGSSVNYTCYGQKIVPDLDINPLLYSQPIPVAYMAPHMCMSETIEYTDDIPLFGPHRPVWPVYGEYKFLPKQRWIHSLEHGAVVMLYHPCANPVEINRLKTLLANCLKRYVVTPYNLLDEDRPLALVTWGYRLSMSYVDSEIVKRFIQEKALRGPEAIPNDGHFDEGLVRKSLVVSDSNDSNLCPNM